MPPIADGEARNGGFHRPVFIKDMENSKAVLWIHLRILKPSTDAQLISTRTKDMDILIDQQFTATIRGQGDRVGEWKGEVDGISHLGQGDAGKQGWRLPTVAELARLVSKKCLNPAIDLKIFPNSPAVEFWGSDSDGAQSGYVDFKDGYIGRDDENLPNAVRLVRDLPAATPGKGKGRPARQG